MTPLDYNLLEKLIDWIHLNGHPLYEYKAYTKPEDFSGDNVYCGFFYNEENAEEPYTFVYHKRVHGHKDGLLLQRSFPSMIDLVRNVERKISVDIASHRN